MVTAVIPVYNEERTIFGLIKVLLKCRQITNIIVVDDSSSDSTYEVISNLPITIIRQAINQGKDLAVLAGVKAATSERILLIDGDLENVAENNINSLIKESAKSRMVLGILKPQGLLGWLFFLNRYFFTRTGFRLVYRKDILDIPRDSFGSFRLESILASQVRQYRWSVKKVVLPGITHIIKERKAGFKWGMILRAKMIIDIAAFYGEKIFRS